MNEQEKLSKILYYSDMHPNNCQFIQDLVDNKDKEIERLHSIIKEARDYITSRARKAGVELMPREKELLEILERANNDK